MAMSRLPILLLLCSLLLPTSSALASGGGGPTGPYFPLEPPFVTNLLEGKRLRFVQVKVQVLSHDSDAGGIISHHMPAVRDRLLMLFAKQDIEAIKEVPQREVLRQQAGEELRQLFQELVGKPLVEQVYFTDFVIQ